MAKIDEAALAEAYNRALKLEKAGDHDAAAAAYQKVLALDPEDHGGVAVRLASLGRGGTPQRAPEAYVTTLFDQHAEVFDKVLVEDLGYHVPLLLRQRLLDLGLGPFDRLLDLGCGTGLTGGALEDMADDVTGVDLAENMVEIAHEKGLYDTLYVAEAVDYLEDNDDEPFDLIAATDVLPYLGDLTPLCRAAAANCRPGALFAFSSETLPDNVMQGRAFMVGPFQRFAHASTYVEQQLAAAGFALLEAGDIIVRYEQGQPIAGHLYLARFTGPDAA
ncbi:class I SAM-dependent DNA methyltransferase [Pseudohoeflea coraliihabitans]|uniref:Methyltransferase domain-containing protein n=1 Tax=Pseudohoeflea coraliihabitans TaxID=2860393 RepID=A0ABS6WQ09_9HYPH|nr:methyltransferase domain-containing protein [Pseudohoeflea sp. DP4N28-3]MBW3098005.1 methyltransferase domain-containing protein [Pseudohoeflea sp. DP4N28-3]